MWFVFVMKRGVRIYFLLLVALTTLGVLLYMSEPVLIEGLASQAFTFKGSFGEEFQYSSPVDVEYNPHGGADRAMFFWSGKPLGGVNVIGLPPNNDDVILRQVITEDIKKTTGAVEVTHVGFDNSHAILNVLKPRRPCTAFRTNIFAMCFLTGINSAILFKRCCE